MIANELARDVSSAVLQELKALGAESIDPGQLRYDIERKTSYSRSIDHRYEHDYYSIRIDQEFLINRSSSVQVSGANKYGDYIPSLTLTATPRIEKRYDKWGNLTERWCEIQSLLSYTGIYGPLALINGASGKPISLNQDKKMDRFEEWTSKQSPMEFHY